MNNSAFPIIGRLLGTDRQLLKLSTVTLQSKTAQHKMATPPSDGISIYRIKFDKYAGVNKKKEGVYTFLPTSKLIVYRTLRCLRQLAFNSKYPDFLIASCLYINIVYVHNPDFGEIIKFFLDLFEIHS